MDIETSSSASCRIVVVSSSLDTSREVAYRIKALAGDTSDVGVDTSTDSPALSSSSELIHWTINNKYYTAPVHFHPIHLEGLEFIELDDVPAVIYAWKENEPYRVHMKQIAEQTSSYSPEVSLAISMTPTTDDQLETFFFEHGFEYVEGHKKEKDKSEEGLSESSDTPGLHRAIDALSTIMWPSMVRTAPKASKLARHSPLSLYVEDNDNVDVDYQMLTTAAGSDGKINMRREMEMLEQWLEEDDDDRNKETTAVAVADNKYSNNSDGYASLDSHEHSISMSISNDPWSTTTPGVPTDAPGFDDDFTEFVSAPAPSGTQSSSSLRPASELEEEDSETELPTEAEVRAASARIFGPRRFHSQPDPDRSGSQRAELDTYAILPESTLDHAGSNSQSDLAGDRPIPELDMDAPAFDLTHILGALNGMKDEISQMPDIRERRRAAAKAALGLVYGLEDTTDELDAHLA